MPPARTGLRGPRTTAAWTLLAAALVATLHGHSVQAAVECSTFTSCADCVCETVGYTLRYSCGSSPSCQWCEGTGSCVASTGTCPSGKVIQSFYPSQVRDDDDVQRNSLCPLPADGGAVAAVCIFMSIAALSILSLVCKKLRGSGVVERKFRAYTTEIQQDLRRHIPDGEVVAWEGHSRRPAPGSLCSALGTIALPLLMLTVPSIVWLGIGIPSSVERNWGFGFFFPICFVGGLGTFFMSLALALLLSSDITVSAYALTQKYAFVASGSLEQRKLKTLTAKPLSNVSSVTVAGNTVSFKTGLGLIGGTWVSFANLQETGPIFQRLQALQSGASAGAAPGVPSAIPVTVANPVGKALFGGAFTAKV